MVEQGDTLNVQRLTQNDTQDNIDKWLDFWMVRGGGGCRRLVIDMTGKAGMGPWAKVLETVGPNSPSKFDPHSPPTTLFNVNKSHPALREISESTELLTAG